MKCPDGNFFQAGRGGYTALICVLKYEAALCIRKAKYVGPTWLEKRMSRYVPTMLVLSKIMHPHHCSGNSIEFSCILDPFSCAILTLNEPANLK